MYLMGNLEFSKRAKSALGLEISGNPSKNHNNAFII